ncbi:hypothetical protein [Pseudosulfitobacter koreensis]|uniref:Uncharacterized protein n=1 Tax=Pseudosulfitobacter koreensis TaxID=2968472 RepID=A0ABT1Z2P6_9RHOB|nr:hypothetical protein [Pseudosulfitobacter koreense]MCR8827383.1 hypothetical protein [Pseudosulfitobacter koreense]
MFPQHSLVWFRFWGDLNRLEINTLMSTYWHAPGYDPAFAVLQDFRGTDTNDLTHSELVLMAEKLKALRQKLGISMRLALLAPGDLGFGMGRMFVTLLGNAPLVTASAFRDLEGVGAFLNLTPEARALIGSPDVTPASVAI